MRFKAKIKELVAALLLVLAVVCVALAISDPRAPGDSGRTARRVSRIVSRKAQSLGFYMQKALEQNPYEWMELPGLPDDMVIYRYCADTLQSWVNQFPLTNDNLNTAVMFSRLVNPRINIESPLMAAGDSLVYVSIGSKWYLLRSIREADCRVIGGIEIADRADGYTYTGINSSLKIPYHSNVCSLSNDEGAAVYVDGRPLFKVFCESLSGRATANPLLMWIAMGLVCAACVLYLMGKKTLRRFFVSSGVLVFATVSMYFWGHGAQNVLRLFSPLLFAGGAVLSSLGAVLLINLMVLMLAAMLHFVREDLCSRIRTRTGLFLCGTAAVLAAGLVVLYLNAALRSIVVNSNISLELHRFTELSLYSGLVYASFILTLVSVPLLVNLMRPAAVRLLGIDKDTLSLRGRIVFAAVVGLWMTAVIGVLSFDKEEKRMSVLADRLAIDRNIPLELRLRGIESVIADDLIISSLSVFEGTESTIQSRIQETTFSRMGQDYVTSVQVLNNDNSTPESVALFESRIRGGVPIADNSRFLFVNRGRRPYYAGVFIYYVEGQGYSRVLFTVESKVDQDGQGYAAILGMIPPGRVSVPPEYSYARYEGTGLQFYKGSYAYPTRMDEDMRRDIYEKGNCHNRTQGYVHFMNLVSDTEAVIISRPVVNFFNFAVSALFIGLLAFLMVSLTKVRFRFRRNEGAQRSYYKGRISAVLMISLLLTLVAMALVSVLFVYKQNERHTRTMMVDRLTAISSMLDMEVHDIEDTRGLMTTGVHDALENVASSTGSDLTLFSPDGRVLMSTSPLVMERQLLDPRIDGDVYNSIILQNRRYYIKKEHYNDVAYYNVYAPLFGARDKVVAILCTPYTNGDIDFEKDAATHLMAILSVFLLLLLLTRFMSEEILQRMFKPLGELGRKMDSTSLDSLDRIEYSRNDEVQSLVTAYNRMVGELSESSQKLAQAERDKAWSGMARQVAHEIKNPLTPMKLQLQRVMRLKQKNDPEWVNRFDDAYKVLLDHIDILTDTANEFSTFAKLYTEEPTEINLDLVLQEEIAMFDNREDVSFDYMGLSGALVQGPKPQLIRVFVNLLSNAVQAVEENGGGRILVSLRNSTVDGFYDIVVEDDGPGVSAENLDKLFTPNFTTKNGGSGLGLAISRSILERCGADMSYSRSFSLGGACFTVRYPK